MLEEVRDKVQSVGVVPDGYVGLCVQSGPLGNVHFPLKRRKGQRTSLGHIHTKGVKTLESRVDPWTKSWSLSEGPLA